jgi:hypothetical protein
MFWIKDIFNIYLEEEETLFKTHIVAGRRTRKETDRPAVFQ